MSYRATPFILVTLLAACAQTTAIKSADRIVEPIQLAAPQAPELCQDSARPDYSFKPKLLVYLFTDPFCDACKRQLHDFAEGQQTLLDHNVGVYHEVLHVEGDCFHATPTGRRAPFPFAAPRNEDEVAWGVRSTPTIWLVDPATNKTIAYVEGTMSVDEVVAYIPK